MPTSETSSVSQPAKITGPDTRLSRVRSLAKSDDDLHGRRSPFSRMQHSEYTVWHKKFTAAVRLAFKAIALVSREVVTFAYQVSQDIASTASAETELAEASARREFRA